MNTEVIQSSISKSMPYLAYLEQIKTFAKAYKTSGVEQTENQIEYTKLNASRMRRIEKLVYFSQEELTPFMKIGEKQTWLVISETWCGDGAQIVPVLNKIAGAVPQIDLRIVYRDENPGLMDLFLTNGARAIPKLIMLDKDLEVITTWGPRPKNAAKMVADYKLAHGKIDAEFKADLQKWYNDDKGISILEDLSEIVGDIVRSFTS